MEGEDTSMAFFSRIATDSLYFVLSLTFSCLLRCNSVSAEDRRSEHFVGQRKLKR